MINLDTAEMPFPDAGSYIPYKETRGTINLNPSEMISDTIPASDATTVVTSVEGVPPEPIVDIYTPLPTDGENEETFLTQEIPQAIVSPSIMPPVVTTVENSPIGTTPTPVGVFDSPLAEVTSLLDLFKNGAFATPTSTPITPAQQPGVTVIPTASDGGSSSSVLVLLGILGIAVTIGVYWYFNRKKG